MTDDADTPTPGPLVATDANGNPGAVVSGELIESAWGNAVSSRVVKRFPTSAARDAAIPAPVAGMVVWVADTNRMHRYATDSVGVVRWIPFNEAGQSFVSMQQAGAQAHQAQLAIVAKTGSPFANPMIALTDETAATSGTISWWSPLSRIQFFNAGHGSHVYLEAAGYVTAALDANAYPVAFADLVHEETDSNGEPARTVDLAELVHRLIQRLADLEARVADM